jgi:hypothetical protein
MSTTADQAVSTEWRFRKSIIDRWLDDQILKDSDFSNLRNR